ncbi:MAG: hypothetical protein KAI79_06350 [Bacteroidales bacterium]|nr:hypothetical protein [Bacteroidales bacterium]
MNCKYIIARKPGKTFANGLTSSNLGKPSYGLMLEQHDDYLKLLKEIGIEVHLLEADEKYPDAHFVEDTAIVIPEVGIITNPGAEARKGEEVSIEKKLLQFRKIERILAPGTVDGGDILLIDRIFYVGISERTNLAGAKQLSAIVSKYNYTTENIKVEAGLHLKSSVNYVGNNNIVITKEFKDLPNFNKYNKIILENNETYAANCLFLNNYLIMPKGFPVLKEALLNLNYNIKELITDFVSF